MKLTKLLTENDANDLVKLLDKKMKQHDWYYGFSDDSRVHRNGKMERQEIVSIMQKLHDLGAEKESKKLWDKYTSKMQYMWYPIK